MISIIFGFVLLTSGLLWYLLKHDHGRRLPVASLWTACAFGLLAFVMAIASEALLPIHNLADIKLLPLLQQLRLVSAIGIIEEAAKFVPLALFLYHKRYFREHTDGIIYFAICGLTFGLIENIMYTVSHGTTAGLARLIVTPFFHAATTSIIGYYFVSMKLLARRRGRFLVACLLLPLLHGLYDFGLFSGVAEFVVISLMVTVLLTVGLFLYFMEANELDQLALASHRLAPAHSPAAGGTASVPGRYCSACGRANTAHGAFCESCGHTL